ncbi:MAG: phage tail protein [Rhizobiaceae bacterium]
MMAGDRFRSYNFTLIFEREIICSFVECSGLSGKIDVIAYREGGANQQIRQLPGQVCYQPVILRYENSQSTELWEWCQDTRGGDSLRRNLSVTMLENDGTTETFRWNFSGAWVSAWPAASADPITGEITVETMSIIYDRMERVRLVEAQ